MKRNGCGPLQLSQKTKLLSNEDVHGCSLPKSSKI